MTSDSTASYEALMQFLYQAPIGLMQVAPGGEIMMINPMSAQLLMPLAPDGNLHNLFDVLNTAAPQLHAMATSFSAPSGVVCESLRIALPAGAARGTLAQTLELSLLKLDDGSLMVSLSDATLTVQQEQQRLALQLRDANRTDNLTALPNRTVVLERIGLALAAARRNPDDEFAVMFINCDRFNGVNVALGQDGGDELLRLLAGRLNGTVRAGRRQRSKQRHVWVGTSSSSCSKGCATPTTRSTSRSACLTHCASPTASAANWCMPAPAWAWCCAPRPAPTPIRCCKTRASRCAKPSATAGHATASSNP